MVHRTMALYSLLFLFFCFFVSSCRYLWRPAYERRDVQAYRCGRYENRLYVREIFTEEYPDLGLVLGYADVLGLSPKEKNVLTEKAAECYRVCEAMLEDMYRLQNSIKEKIMQNKDDKLLSEISYHLNLLEEKKQKWLLFHKKCYEEGLSLLSREQLNTWRFLEEEYRPLPGS
ncbi:MAG: hypothetical protein RML34_03785 [Leptospiraceae bacterium]|nr:hypothetical protein [Leptospiraceae bacterium]